MQWKPSYGQLNQYLDGKQEAGIEGGMTMREVDVFKGKCGQTEG